MEWMILAALALLAVPPLSAATSGTPDAAGAHWIASPNYDQRKPEPFGIDTVVLHSTCMPTNETMETVRHFQDPRSKVSSHYVVGKDGQVVQLVAEQDRAWHAGICQWQGRTDVNSCSIGIEMVHRDQDPNDDWPPAQVEAVARLLFDIRSRHRIPNDHVIFHSECAYPPGRKTDPVGFDRAYVLQRVAQMAVEAQQINH